jgi:hypothetical protein
MANVSRRTMIKTIRADMLTAGLPLEIAKTTEDAALAVHFTLPTADGSQPE